MRAAQPSTALTFDIAGYKVEGNTLLEQRQIDRLLKPYTGKARDFGDVQKALQALERAYARAGYGALRVYLPEQQIADGIVRFKVVEGRIRRVLVPETRYFNEANLRRSVPAVKEGASPNAARISDNLRLANENPAKQTSVLLRAGAEPGDIDATIEVTERRPWRPFFTLDNTGSPTTGDWRAGVGLQHANLFNRDQIFTAQYITSPDSVDRVTIVSAGYHVPLYRLGDSVDFVAGYSDVDAGTSITAAGPLTFSGSGAVAGARYNWFLRRRGEYEHKIVFGLDYRYYDNVCSLAAFGGADCPVGTSTVAVLPVSLTYAGAWGRPGSQLNFYGGVHQNIPGIGHGDDADFEQARPGAKAAYTLLRAGVSYARALPRDLQVRLAMTAQYTEGALIPGEQFGLGGASSVRGFLEREISKDRGFSTQLELYSPDVAARLKLPGTSLRALAFFDYGQAELIDPQPLDIAREAISSAGLGVRLAIGRNFSLRGDVGWVLDAGGTQGEGDARGHFALFATF